MSRHMYKAQTSTSINVNGGQVGRFYLCFVGAHSVNGVLVWQVATSPFAVSLECLCFLVATSTSPFLWSVCAAKLRHRRFSGVLLLPSCDLAVSLGCFGLPSCDLAVSPECLCCQVATSPFSWCASAAKLRPRPRRSLNK